MNVSWYLMPLSLAEIYQRLRRRRYLYLQLIWLLQREIVPNSSKPWMDLARSFETSEETYNTTWRQNAEKYNLCYKH
jgi:hypothetical protein